MDTNTTVFAIIVGLILLLAAVTPHYSCDQPRPAALQPTVAVIPFNNTTAVKGIGEGTAKMMRSALEECPRYQLVEEERIRAVLQQANTFGEIIDPAEALELGRAVEASYVILGTVTKVEIGHKIIEVMADVQVIKTDTGAVVASPYKVGKAQKGTVRITAAELAKTTFYGEGPTAKLVREASWALVKRLVATVVKSF